MSTTSIYSIPNDVMGYTLYMVLQEPYADNPNSYRRVYKCVYAAIRTCKWWYKLGIKLLDPTIMNHKPFRDVCCSGNIFLVEHMLKDSRIKTGNYDIFLRLAIEWNRPKVVQLLLDDGRFNSDSYYYKECISSGLSHASWDTILMIISKYREVSKHSLKDCLLSACFTERIDAIKLILKDERIKTGQYDILKASNGKRVRIQMDYEHIITQALELCIQFNSPEAFKVLMKESNFKPTIRTLRSACIYTQAFAIKELLPLVSDPNEGGAHAPLFCCIEDTTDSVECFKILLDDPRVDPSLEDNYIVYILAKKNRLDLLMLVVEDERVNPKNRLPDMVINYKYYGDEEIRFILYKYRKELLEFLKDPLFKKQVVKLGKKAHCILGITDLL